MRVPELRSLALSLVIATAVFAGCSGGGKSLVQAPSQQSVGQQVPVTFTVTIGSQSQTQSTKRSPQFIPSNTQSIVIDYIGDNPSATPAPGATPPANVTTAATVNVTATTTNPPPAGECFASNGTYTCTISLKLPVGVIDLYVLAYAGQNGTGLLLAGNVVIAQVNANGTVTQPGGSAPISIALVQKGVQVGTATIGSNATIVPNGVPKPSVAAPSYPTNTAPYVYSAAETVAVANPSGTPIPAGTPISSITVTDNETGGASCLVYIPNGATTATPCPFATSASSVTLSTSGDSYALLYNGKFAPAGSISITGSVAGSSTVPTPITVAITPTVFTVGHTVTFSTNNVPIGALAYDSVGSALYVGIGSASTPLYKSSYSPSTGYASPAPVAVVSVNGVSRPLSGTGGGEVGGGPNAMVIGPDNNLWFVENNGEDSVPYVAVAVINSAAVNPAGGAAIQPGAGVFAEYTLAAALGTRGNASPPLKTIASLGGFIWVMDKRGDFYRINPTTGLVSPNLATGYGPGTTPSTPTNASNPVTDPTGATQISGGSMTYAPMVVLGSSLYVPNDSSGSVNLLALDMSATPSTGICSPAGGSPCIATFTAPFTGLTSPEDGATTDGTSIYVINDSSNGVYKLTPPATVVSSTAVFPSFEGGLAITSDGWFWTLTSTGVAAIEGMTSATTLSVNNASCPSNEWLGRGANGLLVGPDGTLLFSPNLSRVSGPTVAPLCAVVY